MKLSLAVLLLIGENNARHHQQLGGPVRPKKDVSEKNIDPWVYEKVYDAVNPQPLQRNSGAPVKDTYTPYGNAPYWPNNEAAAEDAQKKGVPAEIPATKAAALAQMQYNRAILNRKADVSDKKINPWVYEKVYDAVNPQAYDRRNLEAPPKDSYTPYGNAPYWQNQAKAPAQAEATAPSGIPAELTGTKASLAQMRGDRLTQNRKADVSDKKIQPWVFEKVYDAVNPQQENRAKEMAPAKDSYPPYGNAPYWPNKDGAAKAAPEEVPAELNAEAKAAPVKAAAAPVEAAPVEAAPVKAAAAAPVEAAPVEAAPVQAATVKAATSGPSELTGSKAATSGPSELTGSKAATSGPSELMGTKAALAQMRYGGLVTKKKRDISDKNIDPWVYDFAYDNVNPQPLQRRDNGPKPDIYWKDIYDRDTYGKAPSELEGAQPSNLSQNQFIQFVSDTDDILEQQIQPADDFAQIGEEPAELAIPPKPKAKGEAKTEGKGSINEFDGTAHNENGARYFPNGRKVDGVNNWIMAQQVPAAGQNEFDGTYHHANGARYFPDGSKAAGVNSWLAQEEPAAPATPAKAAATATPAEVPAQAAPATAAPATADSKNLNPFDGLEHKNGTTLFPDGQVVGGVNVFPNLGQANKPANLAQEEEEEEPATPAAPVKANATVPAKANATAPAKANATAPAKANATAESTPAAPVKANATAPAKGPTSPINEFDGSVHADGKRFFPDGKEINGVNLRLTQEEPEPATQAEPMPRWDGTYYNDNERFYPDGKKFDDVKPKLVQTPSLRLTQIPKIRSFAQIIQPPKLAQKKEDDKGDEPAFGMNPEKVTPPEPKINPFDGLYHNADGSRDFSTGGKVRGVNLWLPQQKQEAGDFIHDFQVNSQ